MSKSDVARRLEQNVLDVNSVLWLLHHVVVGDIIDVSEVHATSICRGRKININN
jgi:hypothetical protein